MKKIVTRLVCFLFVMGLWNIQTFASQAEEAMPGYHEYVTTEDEVIHGMGLPEEPIWKVGSVD